MTRDLHPASDDCNSEKQARIRDSHVKALNALADDLRSNRLPNLASDVTYDVPYFDPCDGGVGARVLFLFEKPGRRAANDGGSGFISRDNNDETARATKRFLDEAGFAREETILWNVIPGWNGTRRITVPEKNHARNLADEYLGRTHPGLKRFVSTHPSPICRSRWYARWKAIPGDWREVADYIHRAT